MKTLPSGLLLAMAILFEVLGTTSMKLSYGFSQLLPSIFIFVCYALSFACLTLCLKKMEMSVAYAIWSGLGTVLIAVVGIVIFKEQLSGLQIVSLGLIICGVVGLNLID